jgi:hypothetical protein
MEPTALAQLKERYYEPGLLAKVLGYNTEPLRDVRAFQDLALYPTIELQSPTDAQADLAIHVINRGGGIGRVSVKINGKEILADARGPMPRPHEAEVTLPVRLAHHPLLIPGADNVTEVQAYNSEGYLASRGVRTVCRAPGAIPSVPPTLWGIVVGVSDYTGDELDLRYAGKDAVAMAQALTLGAQRLFGAERVRLHVLTTEPAVGAETPTKANLIKAFNMVAASATPTDILVVYLAGHGVVHGGVEGDFYYLTRDARSGNLTDPEIRKHVALSSAELTEWIKRVPARNKFWFSTPAGQGAWCSSWRCNGKSRPAKFAPLSD